MKHNFIGYASLLSHTSLESSIKDKKFTPVLIKGYKRIFNFQTRENENSDVLNIVKSPKNFFNAVIFKVNDKELKELAKREAEYNLEEVEYYNLSGKEKIGKGIISVDKLINIDKNKKLPSKNYFILCRSAAYKIGKDFGKMWDQTTFISDGEKVSDWIKNNKEYDVLN